ncbi:hypothetical protein ACTL6U_21395 [Rhodovibrionaceae bacterium A322]
MLISYNTEILREICFCTSAAIEYLGEEAAVCLQARHSDIQAASSISELLIGQVSFDANQLILEMPNLLVIKMVPNYPALESGSQYDWSTVSRVKLMGINDVS